MTYDLCLSIWNSVLANVGDVGIGIWNVFFAKADVSHFSCPCPRAFDRESDPDPDSDGSLGEFLSSVPTSGSEAHVHRVDSTALSDASFFAEIAFVIVYGK